MLPRVDDHVANLPGAGIHAARVALSEEVILEAIARIEDVKLQSLRNRRIPDPEIEIKDEVCGASPAAERLEEQRLGIWMRSPQPELGRSPIQRSTLHALRERVGCTDTGSTWPRACAAR